MKKIFAVFGIIGCLLLMVAVFLIIKQSAFVNHSQKTTGTVIGNAVSYSNDSNGNSSRYYHAVVVFADQSGQAIKFQSTLGSGSPSYQVGETVEVLYDPDKPNDAEINSFISIWLGAIIVSILGVIFSLVGFIYLIVVRKKSKLKRELLNHGRRIEATLSSVELNTLIRMNGRSPYVICSQWVDKLKPDELYIFKSDNIWFNPEPYIKKETISVFIDEKNPHRYYVDISFLPKVK